MISQLLGKVVDTGSQELYVDIGAIVLKVFIPDPSCYRLQQSIQLHTELIWKETGPSLYGFESQSDVHLFNELMKIHSVGPKLALSIMGYPRELFIKACHSQQANDLCSISGVGKKTAHRIIAELDLSKIALAPMSFSSSIKSQARLALLNLGFQERAIDEALMEYQGVGLDECIKESLLKLGERRATTSRQRSRTQTETS